MILWNFTMIYDALLLILVSSEPYLKFKIYIITFISKTFITIVNRKSYFYSSKDQSSKYDIWNHIELFFTQQ